MHKLRTVKCKEKNFFEDIIEQIKEETTELLIERSRGFTSARDPYR